MDQEADQKKGASGGGKISKAQKLYKAYSKKPTAAAYQKYQAGLRKLNAVKVKRTKSTVKPIQDSYKRVNGTLKVANRRHTF